MRFREQTFARLKKTPALQANDKLVAIQSNLHNIKIQKYPILPVKALQLEPLVNDDPL